MLKKLNIFKKNKKEKIEIKKENKEEKTQKLENLINLDDLFSYQENNPNLIEFLENDEKLKLKVIPQKNQEEEEFNLLLSRFEERRKPPQKPYKYNEFEMTNISENLNIIVDDSEDEKNQENFGFTNDEQFENLLSKFEE
jgi:hypothetical protein